MSNAKPAQAQHSMWDVERTSIGIEAVLPELVGWQEWVEPPKSQSRQARLLLLLMSRSRGGTSSRREWHVDWRGRVTAVVQGAAHAVLGICGAG